MKHLLRQLVLASLHIIANQIVQDLIDRGYHSQISEMGSHLIIWVDKKGTTTKSFFLEKQGSQYQLAYGNPNSPSRVFNINIKNNQINMDNFLQFLKTAI